MVHLFDNAIQNKVCCKSIKMNVIPWTTVCIHTSSLVSVSHDAIYQSDILYQDIKITTIAQCVHLGGGCCHTNGLYAIRLILPPFINIFYQTVLTC